MFFVFMELGKLPGIVDEQVVEAKISTMLEVIKARWLAIPSLHPEIEQDGWEDEVARMMIVLTRHVLEKAKTWCESQQDRLGGESEVVGYDKGHSGCPPASASQTVPASAALPAFELKSTPDAATSPSDPAQSTIAAPTVTFYIPTAILAAGGEIEGTLLIQASDSTGETSYKFSFSPAHKPSMFVLARVFVCRAVLIGAILSTFSYIGYYFG